MFSPGKADTPITIQALTVTQDGMGGSVEAWADLQDGPLWAEYLPLRGQERVLAGTLQEVVAFKLRVRRDTRIDATCRVTIDASPRRILSVEDNRREGSMVLHCEEVR